MSDLAVLFVGSILTVVIIAEWIRCFIESWNYKRQLNKRRMNDEETR